LIGVSQSVQTISQPPGDPKVPPKLLLALKWGAPAVVLALIAAAYFGYFHASKTRQQADFQLLGPRGEPIIVQLPQLLKIPSFDVVAACAAADAHNSKARALEKSAPQADDDDDEDTGRAIYPAAEAGCAGGERAYPFYDELADILIAGSTSSRSGTDQVLAAMREALRTAASRGDVETALESIESFTTSSADRMHAPDFYLLGAEAMALRVIFCDGAHAASCRVKAHSRHGQDLFDAGRWRANADLLRAAIAAYREALRDAVPKSADWIDLHTLIGSAFGQLSEQQDDPGKRASLQEALDEYKLAGAAVDQSDEGTWALINQNVCSIRQPLAAMDRDRINTNRAIEECEKARAFYAAHGDMTEEAAAHYNMARAFERLAEWDRDEAAAMRAVEHVRQTVRLYGEDHAILSRAFGQVHLAEALLNAADFATSKADRGALITEARASLDDAEPVLREAQARGYLDRLASARSRLGRDG
jgi:hypothetical protein